MVASAASTALVAVFFAVFIWWFSTGIVLLLNHLSRAAVALSLLLSSLLGGAALVALAHTAQQDTLAGAYGAFTSALLLWGWHELSFLTGWITGPRVTPLPAGLPEGRRFVQSVRAILWHEIGIITAGCAVVALTWGAPNQVGTGTFVVLWVMRTSAKLNLFFGVRNLSEQFLPPHLAYMQTFFRRRTMNLLWPVSVAAGGVVLWGMAARIMDATTSPAHAVGLTLVATLLALAVVEHLLLVLPLDSTALWRWALRESGRDSHTSASEAASASTLTHLPAVQRHHP